MAPEVLAKNKYSEKADVYAFGILLYEIFSGNRPYEDGEFSEMNQAQLMFQILDKQARPDVSSFELGLQQLICDCWDLNPRLRPSFAEIIVRLRRLKLGNNGKNSSIILDYEESGSEIESPLLTVESPLLTAESSSSFFDLHSIN